MMKLVTFPSKSALLDAFHDRLADELTAPAVKGRPAGVMLSGGSTPLPIFQRFEVEGGNVASNIHILYTDDRLVAPDSGDSNFGNSLPMLQSLGVPPDHVLHLDTSLNLEDAAERYDRDLGAFFRDNGVITLGVLGLGPDGHTCSIFSEEDALRDDSLAFAVPDRLGFDRVTVSRLVLGHCQTILFLVSGENKREKIEALLEAPDAIPAGIAVKGHPNVEIWTDVT